MKVTRNIIIGLAVALLVGCGTQLEVTVEVADKSEIRDLPEVQKALNNRYQQAVIEIQRSGFLEDLRLSTYRAVTIMSDDLKANGEDETTIQKKRNAILSNSSIVLERLGDQLSSIVRSTPDSTRMYYNAWISQVYQFRTLLTGSLRKSFSESDKLFGTLIQFENEVQTSQNATQNRITKQFGVFGDPIVSYIIHAPEDIWSSDDQEMKGKFNVATAKTRFGSSDIAVVMEDIGQFYMKGARVDASETVMAISKSANMTLGLVANSLALPLNIPKPSNDGAGESTPSGYEAIYDAELAKRKAENAQRLFNVHTASVIDAILLKTQSLDSDVDSVALVTSLKAIVADYNSSLNSITTSTDQ